MVEELVRPIHMCPICHLSYPTSLVQVLGMYKPYNRNIVHCGLKPGNVLVSQRGHLAIADFGVSMVPEACEDPAKPFEKCNFYGYGGIYAYQPPEMLICHSKRTLRVRHTCGRSGLSFTRCT
jgi:serine/threonine protein kinase